MIAPDSSSSNQPGTDRCPDCGAVVAGGRQGCQALFDEIFTRAYGNLAYAAVRDLAFDAYCMQHLDKYCLSAKSYVAHLTRLCCGLEHGGEPRVYAAIQKWLNGSVALEKPEKLAALGRLSIGDVRSARFPDEIKKTVRDWSESVWEAYASQQALARTWLDLAVTGKPAGGSKRAARRR